MNSTMILNYDVAVCGGGMAGLSAALAAAQSGARVLLVERHPYCGGAFTAGMVLHIAGLLDHRLIGSSTAENPDNWVVKGLAKKFYEYFHAVRSAHGAHWDHEAGKVIFDRMLRAAGVDVLYGTTLHDAVTAGKAIESIELIFRTRKIKVEARAFVDATGDGDLGEAAGVGFRCGRESDHRMMPGTLSYMLSDYERQPEENVHRMIMDAVEKGELTPHLRPAIIGEHYAQGQSRKELWCSFVRQWGDFGDPIDYSRMERDGRFIGWEIFEFLKNNTRSFRHAYISSCGHQLWPREGRSFDTLYRITRDDVFNAARFEHVVARGAFYLDVHSVTPGTQGWDLDLHREQRNSYFEIPYEALVPVAVTNLFLAGRTIGATHEGHGATRVMGTGIATGQAAGCAASMVAAGQGDNLSLKIEMLQKTLRGQDCDI